MDILNLNIDIPKHVCVSKNATSALVETILAQKLLNVIVVYTGSKTAEHAERLVSLLKSSPKSAELNIIKFCIKSPSLEEMKRLDQYCSNFIETPIIVGVGGGSCIDVVKYVAANRRLKLFIYPTVLSSDCLASPISVLKDGKKKVRLQGAVPNGIFIDVSITAKAPRALILSGVADLMSNVSALLDINYCEVEQDRQSFAVLLSRASYKHITSMKEVAIDRPRFQAALAQGLILSGLSMNIAGSSITASGAEHLICHALDYYDIGNCSHGKQVYIGMLASDLLRKHLNEPSISKRALRAMKCFGLPEHIDKYGISPHDLVKAIMKAPELRPDRETVLNKASDLEAEQVYEIIKALYKDEPKKSFNNTLL